MASAPPPSANGVRYGAVAKLVNVCFAAGLALTILSSSAMAAQMTLLALGDSLTAGFGLARDESFAARLEVALRAKGYDVRVVNAGVSGDTSAGGRSRLDWALTDKPHAAVVELGANDGLRGLDPAVTFANLDAIVGRLKAAGVAVLLTGMKALPNLGVEFGAEFENVFPRVASKHGVPLYPFFLDGVATDPALNLPDRLHPNARGIDVIVERILPHVTQLLDGLAR